MFLVNAFVSLFAVHQLVEAVPVVFKESTPNGESIVAISSSDPNVEKYFTQQLATRSGFTQVKDNDQHRYNNVQRPQGTVHSSFSFAGPGKALAGAGRSFASASTGPFLPIFSFPIAPDGFGFNNFDLKDWVRSVESYYNPNFAGNSPVNTATAINDNGHIYGNVNDVTFDNRDKNTDSFVKTDEKSLEGKNQNIPSLAKKVNTATVNNESGYKKY